MGWFLLNWKSRKTFGCTEIFMPAWQCNFAHLRHTIICSVSYDSLSSKIRLTSACTGRLERGRVQNHYFKKWDPVSRAIIPCRLVFPANENRNMSTTGQWSLATGPMFQWVTSCLRVHKWLKCGCHPQSGFFQPGLWCKVKPPLGKNAFLISCS